MKHLSFLVSRGTITLLFFLLISFSLKAQAPIPPLPMELMFGHERLDYQLVMKRNFTATSKFSVLAIAVFSENYGKGKKLGDSVVIPF